MLFRSVEMVAGDWTVFTLDSPFEYDGTSNLALIMDDNTGGYSSGMKCRVYEAQGNQALRVCSDGTNYNPSSPSNYNGTLMNVKNQLMLGIEMGTSQVQQTIELAVGTNWFSTHLDITLVSVSTISAPRTSGMYGISKQSGI